MRFLTSTYHRFGASSPLKSESDVSPSRSAFEEQFREEERRLNAAKVKKRRRWTIRMIVLVGLLVLVQTYLGFGQYQNTLCDTVNDGYTCRPNVSHFWGQYSPYFAVPSDISRERPEQCEVTFVQILSRHGARDPTASKTAQYSQLMKEIHASATSYSKKFAFMKDYKYQLGADQLSQFGRQQMVNSGIKYYNLYKDISRNVTPVIRASGQQRVVESAQKWMEGFHKARLLDSRSNNDPTYPYNMTVIREGSKINNTLSHGQCKAFESGHLSKVSDSAKKKWASIFTPNITARLNENVPGMIFDTEKTIDLMDLCPFDTVADEWGTLSPFCSLFTDDEWRAYDYYQSLSKYYGFSWGNPLGPTQGVGFANELIARLTNKPVKDNTSTNSTLDSDPVTFPLKRGLAVYADFSHDNDMISIFSALGFYNSTAPLSNTTLEDAEEMKGYSTSWAVPFAARAYIEKQRCEGVDEEFVRVMVNDRVVPLVNCGADSLGRCKLSSYVASLSFAQEGGHWDDCL